MFLHIFFILAYICFVDSLNSKTFPSIQEKNIMIDLQSQDFGSISFPVNEIAQSISYRLFLSLYILGASMSF